MQNEWEIELEVLAAAMRTQTLLLKTAGILKLVDGVRSERAVEKTSIACETARIQN